MGQSRSAGLEGIPTALAAEDVMTRPAVTVEPGTPVADVARRMTGDRRALPVVDGGFPVGIITQTDLVFRAGVAPAPGLLDALDPAEREALHEALGRTRRTAVELMTPDPACVAGAAPLREAAELMARRGFKRLPVLDAAGRVAGILSRVDVLRVVAGGGWEPPDAAPPSGAGAGAGVASVMRPSPPTVPPGAPLETVLRAVAAGALDRALVVDAEGHVLGVVTDALLLERIAPPLRRGLFSGLVSGLPFGHAAREEAERHATARTAAEIMVPVPCAPPDLPLRDAIALVLPGAHKLLAVVDAEGRLLGALDRADILRGALLEG